MSKALLRYIRLSPTKARLIAREVQGMSAELAIASLEFTPNKAARVISKVIASAVANGGYDAQDVIVTSCRVDAGPVLRRFMPRAKGRATPIRKPTAHILVEVGTQKSTKSSAQTQVKTKQANAKSAKASESNASEAKLNKSNTKSSVSKTKDTSENVQSEVKSKATKANLEAKSSDKKVTTKKKNEGEEK